MLTFFELPCLVFYQHCFKIVHKLVVHHVYKELYAVSYKIQKEALLICFQIWRQKSAFSTAASNFAVPLNATKSCPKFWGSLPQVPREIAHEFGLCRIELSVCCYGLGVHSAFPTPKTNLQSQCLQILSFFSKNTLWWLLWQPFAQFWLEVSGNSECTPIKTTDMQTTEFRLLYAMCRIDPFAMEKTSLRHEYSLEQVTPTL